MSHEYVVLPWLRVFPTRHEAAGWAAANGRFFPEVDAAVAPVPEAGPVSLAAGAVDDVLGVAGE